MTERSFTSSIRKQPIVLHSPILGTVARFTVPLCVFVSLILFFQGHNQPGGGFIAGVLAAAAGSIALLAYGVSCSMKLPYWIVPLLVAPILPFAGPSAVVIAMTVGSLFWLTARNRTIGEYPWWMMGCAGLTISVMTGAVPFLFGYAFMDHAVWRFHVPLWGEDHVPTAGFFDLGVYLIDVGTLMTIFVELGTEDD